MAALLAAGAWGTRSQGTQSAPSRILNSAETLSYNRDIRPILSDRCFACHGPDGAARKADLRLDQRDAATAERGGVRAITPGDPNASELIRRITTTDPDDLMPPPRSKLSLSEEERQTLRRWIEQGAEYEPHWAFQPIRVTMPPQVADARWCRDPLDQFVLRRLESEGLTPSPEAGRERWIRRVSYDLTGLPPTPDEVAAFVRDASPEAHERVVDRLLASPHYGERMAVPWLDAARYADSYGFQSDLLSPTWPWRDWVVRAFNDNVPYDEFLTRQLAGDLLPDAAPADRLATAFNRLHRMTNEGGSIPEEWRVEFAADRVETLGAAVLGLTLACARCHDHKYDPVSQREYYQLTAYFNSIDEHGLYERADIVPTPSMLLPTPEQERRLAELRSFVEQRESELEAAASDAEQGLAAWLRSEPAPMPIADIVGRFPLDEIGTDGTLDNLNDAGAGPGRSGVGASTEPPVAVPGRIGGALRLDGDNIAHLPGVADLDRWTPFTISLWVRDTLPASGERVVAHRSSGTDAGHYGFDLIVSDGRVLARGYRHWPGNAIAVTTTSVALPPREWTHIVWAYDGSSTAAGFSLFINGERAGMEILRDHVWKTIGGGSTYGPGGHDLVLGQRFRDRGLAGGEFDDVVIVRRAVTEPEALWLYKGDLQDASVRPSDLDPAQARALYLSAIDERYRAAASNLATARRELAEFENSINEIMVMDELPAPRETHLLARGAYDAPRDASTLVSRDVPRALGGDAAPPHDRLELAAWLTSPDHPLTARVAVNRLWQICFGRGLVETSENLGLQGQTPSHPELLDFLAREFIDSGWDTKAMLKRIVLSATYRQDSRLTPALLERDPDNVLLARGPSRRLDGEMIRDTALAASGLLVRDIGGPPVSPYQPPGLWREFNGFSPAYTQGNGPDLYRRSLYTVWKRTAPMPSMLTFDAPGREVCVARRTETNTPLQALVLLNDTQFVEAARVLAERAMHEHSGSEECLGIIFQRLTGREPTAAEQEVLLAVLDEQRQNYAAKPDDAHALIGVGESPPDASLDPVELAAWTNVAQAVLNADATVWQR